MHRCRVHSFNALPKWVSTFDLLAAIGKPAEHQKWNVIWNCVWISRPEILPANSLLASIETSLNCVYKAYGQTSQFALLLFSLPIYMWRPHSHIHHLASEENHFILECRTNANFPYRKHTPCASNRWAPTMDPAHTRTQWTEKGW